ncbi:arabinogalactan endo-beta-1,4-galactanase [Spirochaetia bacterium]|nr:arabinogalactan endo-beta-1,4-galactanase [Spirochaetia bacterium]
MKEFKFEGSFASGADVGWLPQMEQSGFVFRNREGREQDLLITLREYGLNALRLRSWVNPSDDPHAGHCSAAETLAMGLRGKAAGYRIMINFHYGDTWCDPGKQVKPRAWAEYPFDKLENAVYEYTRDTMKAFAEGGLVPEWVQLGNETNPGMLLPDGSTDDFAKLTRLYNAAYKGVKEIAPSVKTIIHLAQGNDTAFCQHYFDSLTGCGCHYDMIGLSYYPYWFNKPNSEIIDDLEKTLRLLPDRYDRDIMIVEVGGIDEEEEQSYELLMSVIEKCSLAPRCRGLFYWEPEGAKVWSGYALSAWRADGTPSKAMDAYRSIKYV